MMFITRAHHCIHTYSYYYIFFLCNDFENIATEPSDNIPMCVTLLLKDLHGKKVWKKRNTRRKKRRMKPE